MKKGSQIFNADRRAARRAALGVAHLFNASMPVRFFLATGCGRHFALLSLERIVVASSPFNTTELARDLSRRHALSSAVAATSEPAPMKARERAESFSFIAGWAAELAQDMELAA